MALDLPQSMEALAAALGAVEGLRCYAYPPDSVVVPAAVVGLPEVIEYDETMGRGADRVTVPVYVLVSKASDRAGAGRLGAYLSADGVKAAVESYAPPSPAPWHTVRVSRADVSVISVAGVDYLAATFTLDLVA